MTAAAIAFAAVVMFSSMPPRRIVMATGPEGSAYYEDGERYRAALAKAGVEVQLLPTVGSVETAAMLRDPHSGVSVGLMQGGVTPDSLLEFTHVTDRTLDAVLYIAAQRPVP